MKEIQAAPYSFAAAGILQGLERVSGVGFRAAGSVSRFYRSFIRMLGRLCGFFALFFFVWGGDVLDKTSALM